MAALAMREGNEAGSTNVRCQMSDEQLNMPGTVLTHGHNVALNVVAKREISGDGNENVNRRRRTNTAANNGNQASGRVVLDLVQNRKHLAPSQQGLPMPSPGKPTF